MLSLLTAVFTLVLLTSAGSSTQPPFKVIYESPRSPCYTDGKAHQCTPPFTNVAEGMPVVASSTCGVRGHAEEVCKTWRETDGSKRTFCEVCDGRNSSTARGADRLTDRHIASNQTCWVSDRVEPGSTVNLTLALGKRFEIFYISLQPCGPLPDSIAIYKSSDFGRSWKPWQYFSSDCYRAFGLPTSSEHNVQISSANIQEVLCVALRPPTNHNSMGQTSNVIAFSTIIGRANSQPWSPALIDWMTMTDLQISLSRFPRKASSKSTTTTASNGGTPNGFRMNRKQKPTSTEGPRTTPSHSADSSTVNLQRRDRSNLYYAPKPTTGPPVFRLGQLEGHARQMQADGTDHPMSTTVGPDGNSSNSNSSKPDSDGENSDEEPVRFSFSDIAVGGRCKCNGHSNRCVRDRIVETSPGGGGEVVRWGPLRCDCQHNTVGADCERCAPGHMDRPWARATAEDANVCKPCECYLHSNSCTFSQHLYLMSKKVSGGACENCRHHTTGQRCHLCADGYYRNWEKPISHPQVCLKCRCHPIGSIRNRPCDRKTGQCPCKRGVTGQRCNRCLEGYKQTRSPITPCIKAVDALFYKGSSATRASPPIGLPHTATEAVNCKPCQANKKRINLNKFCRRDAVFYGTVVAQEIHGDSARLAVVVHNVWRTKGPAAAFLPMELRHGQNKISVWISLTRQPDESPDCFCPRLEVDHSYLFISKASEKHYDGGNELYLDNKLNIFPWEESWRRRLSGFMSRKCVRRDGSTYGRRRGPRPLDHVNSLQQNPVAMGMGGGFYPTPEAPPQQPQAQPFKPVYSQPISQYAPAHSPLVHGIGYGSLGHMADEPMKQPVERRPYVPTSYQYRSMRQYSHVTNAYNPYYYSNQLKV